MGSLIARSIHETGFVRAGLLVGIYRWDCALEVRRYQVVRSSRIATEIGLETSKHLCSQG